MSSLFTEVPDSNTLFKDTEFIASNQDVADQWVSIRDLYPSGVNQPLLPEVFSREQFGQGNHYECFMLSALATLIRFPDVIRNCFVTKKVRQDGRYTFQFFRGQEWVKVEIDDTIPLEDDAVLYARSPTEHWWPLLLEKAYAKFYTGYDQLEGCTLQETFHDLTGNPVLNIPMDAKLAKAAGVNTKDGPYWLLMGECLLRGDHVLSALTKDAELESIGMQSEQQYAILGIFSLTGSSALDDIVIHLHNPFEDDEYEYSGPLNKNDSKWTEKLRQQYPVDDRYSIFIPLKLFLKSVNSIQHCFMRTIDAVSQTYSAAWKGESAGGNPTSVLWRKNPLFLVRNSGPAEVKIVTMIQQEDQRRFSNPDSDTTYAQCGVVVTRFTYQHPIPTFYVTGNSHKTIFKGLFLNSRDVSNVFTIPGHSMCYLVPCTMQKGVEASFQLSLYHLKDQDYSQLSVEQLTIPGMNWAGPATKDIELCQKKKDRADFYVDEGTDIHILTHQTKPYVSKSGGDAMTEDFMGMYLYDDTDRKIAGVHAATNFREISIIHRLPRSGRYAISITCPRAKGEVPAYITIVGSHASNVRIVDPPEDATMFDDEDIIDEGEDAALVHNPIDYVPVVFDVAHHDEQAESDSPFEDRRFYVDNRGATSEPWVHIGDLYPEGKTRPLLPNELSRDQFGQGDHYDCSTLTAFAALLEHHPDVIRNCFISKNPRKDGRYTFQFHRYGQWIKVEIDDRIPMVKGDTVFCRSPTHHWWPLLLEKAYAKFYTRYENLENLSQEEVFHDYTGRPRISVSTDPAEAKVNMSYFDEAPYWKELASKLPDLCTTALASGREAEQYGLLKGRHYAVLDIVSIADGERVSDMLVKMYNPYEDSPYTGPMNAKDDAWTSELQSRFRPGDDSHAFYIPADNFVTAFSAMQMGYVGGLAEPSRHFNSEWGQDTNGGDTSLISWRKNPLFIFSNPTNDVVQLVAMLRQPDQRHLLHTMPNQELVYPMKGLSVAQANPSAAGIPTYLVTLDNHRLIHHEKPLAVREVTNVLTIPPQSVCYVAGHCNNRAVSKFLLSYWFMRGEDGEKLRIERYRPKVAQHQPAIAHVDLGNRASERVDFLIDTPTEVHAVLRQEKAFESPQGGDVIAQDYVGVYLYDLQNNCIKGLPSAMNYREVSLVTHLAKPGHYVFFITCPHSSGDVPCKVEIAADEDAHVRITETPQNAAALSALDMAFLDAHPESIPLSELPIDRDLPFQDDLAALERLLSDPSASAEEIQRLKDCLNERAHALAKAILASERPIYLISHDLHALNPLLDDDQAYMDAERERYYLKQDLRNHYKLPAQEAKLRSIADSIADELLHVDLSFIEARPEGIPRDAIPMISDKAFAEMTTDLLRLRRRPEPNPSAIRDAEHRLNERAKELARAMHDTERTYLDQQPQLVPLELLPLNTDESFCAEEDELRQLLQSSPSAQQTIAALQAKLNNHAHELARQLKDGERGKLLAASYEGIPTMETPLTSGQLDALLDKDAEIADMERRLRELRKKPDKNAAAIKALEKEVQKRAQELADGHLAEERSKCLAAEYGGRTMGALPLCDDAAYRDAEAAYMKMLESDHADAAALQRLIDTMNERAAGIAHDMNVADRAKYLPKALRGVPLRALPLDDDDEFRRLEHERARAAGTPGHKAEVEALEAQLLARADELARARLAGDRAYLAPEPAGIPLKLVPLDEDAEFCAKEAQRAELKENGKADRSGIALRETELNARAVEVAQQLKDGERGKLLAASYEGIPTSELPLDTDAAFHEMEVERLRRKASERVMLRSMETPLTSGQLDALLDKDAEIADMERRLRELRKKPDKNAAAIKALEKEVQKRAQELADGHLAEERSKCLAAEYGGRTMGALPLCDDAAYRDAEAAYMKMLESDHADAAALQRLIDTMNERAAGIAHDMNVADRAKYLPKALRGVPLRALPLDDDDEFRRLEHERARAAGTPGHKAEVEALEAQLLARADELARARLAGDRAYLAPEPAGIPLKLVPLDEDAEFCAKEAQRAELKENGKADRSGIALRETELNARAVEVAQQLKDGERGKLLAASYEGIPTSELPLDTDAAFHEMEVERLRRKASERVMLRSMETPLTSGQLDALLDKDAEIADMERRLRELRKKPDKNAAAIKALEKEVQKRAQELADGHLAEERSKCLAAEYGGRTMGALPLCDDAAYRDAEAAYMKMLESDHADAAALQRLIDTMNERAAGIAHDMNVADRAKYLPKALRGVPLRALPLDDDDEFRRLEHERARAAGTPGHKAEVEALEAQLLARADELARARLAGDRAYLAPEPAGIPLKLVPLDEDAEFCAKEAQRAELKENGKADRSGIALRETELNARAVEVAQQLKDGERGKLLAASYEGIPTSELPLDTDAAFHEMEVERLRRKASERVMLRSMETPLTSGQLDALLDKDAEIADMERRLRELRKKPDKNAAAIKALEKEVQKRAQELADGHLAEERSKCLAAEYGGRTMGALPLCDDAAYRDAEAAYMKMLESDHADAAALQRLIDTMNERAAGIAHDMNVADRAKYLPKALRGVPLRALPLDDDDEFRRLEHERARAAGTPGHKAEVEALEAQLLARADELARARLAGDRAYLAPEPAGIPLKLVPLDEDAEFCAKEAQRAELKENGKADRSGIALRETELNARAVEVAQQLKDGERGKLLAASYEGIPTSELPLDTDAAFHEMEVERLRRKASERVMLRSMETPLTSGQLDALLDKDAEIADMERRLRELRKKPDKNAAAIKALEKEVQKRAQELADGHLAEERSKCLAAEYGGRTMGALPLCDDAAYRDAEAAYMKMLESDHADAAALQRLIDTMNERAAGIAHDMNVADRAKYLPKALRGVPLRALPLDDDDEFRRLEHERARAAGTPGHKAEVEALEAQLLARADELARARLAGDRAYLAPEPAGIPLKLVPLDEDAEFCAKEAQRAELKENGKADRSGIALRETELNARAVEVAQQLKDGERGKLLAASYEGIPTSELPLDTDAAFHEMEVERLRRKASERVMLRSMETPLTSGQLDALLDKDAEIADMERRLRELRKKPDKNAAAIKALEKEVQKRAQELADGHLAEERSKCLAAEYGGRTMGALPLCDDAAYRDAEAAYMKMLESDHADAAALQRLIDTMNERAAGIAHDMNVADRAKYLPKALRGVPLRALPLDDDDEFRRLEHERARAAGTPGHKAEVEALEAQLLARADELARARLAGDRAYLAPEPAGIPLKLVPLDEDAEFCAKEAQRAELKENGKADRSGIALRETELNARAVEVAQQLKDGERGKLLAASYEGIPTMETPLTSGQLDALLDKDAEIADMERRLRELRKKPDKNAAAIKALEKEVQKRAQELADGHLAEERSKCLAAEYGGRTMGALPLCDDAAYRDAEAAYMKMLESDHADAAALQRLIDTMNERAAGIAHDMNVADRAKYLPKALRGVPLRALPLDDDDEFRRLEHERARAAGTPGHKAEVEALEAQLLARADELARARLAGDRAYLAPEPAGIPLKLVPLDEDAEFCAKEAQRAELKENGKADRSGIALRETELNARAVEVAQQLKDGERGKLLAASYEGIPTSELPLDTDAAFHEMEVERLRRKASERVMLRSMETPLTSGQLDALLDKDAEIADMERRLRELRKKPDKNAAAIKALEKEVQKRAQELADGHLAEERSKCLAAEYGGRTMGALPLCDDAAYRDAEAAYMKMLESDHADAAALQRLIDTMNERAAGIAHDMNVADRAKYLPKALRGVPLRALPLDDDDEFRRLEHERARAAGTPGHKAEVEALEAQLLARADELARARLAGDRAYLAPEPAGIPLKLVPLDEDAEFCAKEAQRAELKENGKADRSGIALRETELNARAVEVAQQLKDGERGKLLAASYEGIPTSELPLDTDAAFHEMEVERLRRKASERVMLRSMETPLTSGQLDALLDKDAEIADMERRLRELRKKPDKNAAAIKALEKEVQKRAQELADGHLAEERSKCLAAEYGGRTMGALPLCDDAAYRDAEAAYMKMLESDHADAAALQRLIDTMNERAAGIAHDMNVADRAKYLPKALRGVPLRALPLDDDDEFRRLEHERARAAGTPGHKAEVEALEAQLLARADELARARLAGDRAYLAPEPAGIPLKLVPLDEDAEFCAKEAQRAELKENGKADRSGIALRETELNARAVEVAQQLKDGERGKLLAASYEGIPTSELPLDTDAAFHEMEVERLRRKASERVMLRSMETPLTSGQLDALLDKDAEIADMERRLRELRKKPDKNAAAIKALEKEVQKRAQELADGHLAEERSKCLAAEYGGRTMGHFRCATTLRTMLESDHADAAALQRLIDTMNERAAGIAHDMNVADRAKYLPKALRGVPLRALPLDDDDEFRRLEHERARAAGTPGHKAEVEALEAQLLARADELARARLAGDRAYLAPEPAGIPLKLVPLDEDAEFCAKEAQRAELKENGKADRSGIALRETELNARAVEVAQQLKDGERGKLLAASYEGIPTMETPLTSGQLDALLDKDAEIADMERRLRELRKKPDKNAAAIKALEKEVQKRAQELADGHLAEERSKCLAAEYGGRTMGALPLCDDAAYRDAEAAYMKMLESDHADAAALQWLIDTMNERAAGIAHDMNVADRAKYLPKALRGVPLRALPLDDDDEFRRLEHERARAAGTPGHKAEVEALEAQLLARADELARARLAGDRAYLAPEPAGIPLKLVPLDEDAEFCAKEAQRAELKENGKADRSGIALRETELNARAVEVAQQLKDGERGKLLAASYEGIPTMETPLTSGQLDALLDKDAEIADMERRLRELRKKPDKNAAAIKALEKEVQKRAQELADGHLAEERSKCLAAEYGGRTMGALPLCDDAAYRDAEAAYMKMLESDHADAAALQRLIDTMNERAAGIAHDMNVADRAKYLPKALRGVPLRALPLDDDDEFRRLEHERARAAGTPGHKAEVEALEAQLLARADELARARLAGDRAYLAPEPAGIPLKLVPLDEDAEFCAKEAQRAELKENGKADRSGIALRETELNARAVEVAQQLKDGERGKLLAASYEGIPTMETPLTSGQLDALLDKDAEIADMERRLRELRKKPDKNAAAIKALEKEVQKRAQELADGHLAEERSKCLAAEYGGRTMGALPLCDDAAYRDAEAAYMKMLESDHADAAALQRLIDTMNERAAGIAHDMNVADRAKYLPKALRGVPLRALPLDDDDEFRRLEHERARAAGTPGHKAEVEALEAQLLARADELARARLAGDRAYLAPEPAGIPLKLVPLDEDAEFCAKEAQRAELKENGKADRSGIALRETELNARAVEVAQQLKDGERGKLLAASYEGIPTSELPLDTDAAFHEMEVEWLRLKVMDRQPNGATKSSLHAALNRRAADLARSLRVADLSSVEAAPLGLSKELLDLHNDSVCAVLIKELRQLRQNAVGNTAVLREKESALNDRAFEMARRLLSGDRLSYLGPKPLSILLEHIPLDEDDVFHALEVERSMMKVTDPANSVAAVRKAENMLKDRACQLAELVMKEDLANFPPNYHGICTKDLKPHFDRLFSEAAEKRRAGMRDRTITFKENLEQIMDDRLNELALERKEGELYFIDPNPEGVPLSELPLSTDKAFNDLRQGRQELKESDPMENRKAIAGLEDEMNRRAAELARSVLSSDLDGLDKLPLGIPLDLLKPRQDAEVVRLIEELRRSKRLPQLKHNVAELQAKLNERVHELATAALEEGRDAYLDPHPEGVPREILPLRTDAVFQKEVQRAILRLQDPAKHAGAIAHLESELKACVKELALAQKEEDLRGLDQQPHDLPLTLLQPHQDAQLGKMIDELRWLKASEGDQHIAVKEVQSRMNDRCYAMADSAMKGDRCYLDPKPEKVPLRRLPLDTDAAFHALEVERAKLKLTDPRKNEHKIAGLEAQLNSRAAELARAVKKADLKSVEQTPRGIPLELLNLHEDPTFSALIAEKEQLPEGHSADLAARLLSSMNECAMKAADKLLRGDRGYLDQDPEGLPLGHLPLDTDTAFHEMEVERALLKARDPVKNSSTIKDLEAQLNKRAHDLANAALAMDRGYLSPRPEGVSIEELPLFTDSKFHSLEVERAKLKMSRADGHAERMQELEGRLNKRAASLAREQLEEDLKGLDQEPEGYPLNFLRPHNDAVFAAEVVSLRRAKKEPLVSAAKVRDAQEALNVRAHVLARERIAADRARLDQEPENVPLSLLTLEEDALFVAMEMKLRSLKASDKQSPRAITEAEGRMNDRVHVMAAKVKAEGRDFLRSKSFDIPKELLALDADKAFVAMEKELWKQKQQPHAPRSSSAAADLRRKLQARADEVGEAQLKNDRDKYLDMQPEGVDLCDIPLDTDHAYHGMEVKRAILLAQDATGTRSAVEELDKELNARAHELAHEIVVGDRGYLPEEMHGIPVEELPLDTDRKFMKLERQRRAHKRSPDMKKEVAADEEELRNHALKLADEVIAMDLEPIKASYRGIAKEELNLHADVAFRELAKKRRRHRGKGRVEAAEVAAIEDEMDRRACEIADDLITAERAFLDPQPEGMYINEVPLDDDPTFQKLEQEYRRRRRDPRSAKQNGDVLRELTEAMNRRSHTLARAAFAKTRGFMEQEQEGIPLAELGLDEDPEFKEAEIARYRMNHSASPNAATVAEMELRMNERARELAWATLAADRVFLDPMPEGVLLGELPLDSDKEFGDLARERRRRKKTLKGGIGEAEVRAIEEKMNARSHELAKEFLEAERAFLSREPEGVPLADLPLNADSLFRAMEDERLQLKREPLGNAAIIAAKETDLEDRAHVIAKDLLRKERAFLDQEPLGVPLEELPLNHDEILNPIERKRRALRRHPKRNHEAIRACEEQMADRVGQIAEDFVQKERAFLDQNPEGVPLRYLPLNTDREFHERELHRRKLRLRREKNRSELADTERKMNERVHVLAKDLVLKGRAFLHSEPCGVPIADVPLNEDEDFRKMEEQRRALKEAGRSAACVKTIEEKLNNRAEELAQGLLDDERAFMDCAPLGIPLHDLPLNTDRRMREIERTRRHLRKFDPEGGAVDIAVLETGMNARAYELADQLLSSDRDYLQPEPCGVPLADLPLHTDRIFHEKELARFRAKKKGQTDLFQMEDELNERAMELAAEFIQTERAYLDQEPEGIPLERLPLDTDPIFHNIELERRRLKRSGENSPQVLELERLLNRRAHELSMELRGWQDPEFHAANEHVAEQWVRVCDLYPEGRYEDFVPAALTPGDVVSAPQDMSYLVPFIAALTQHPVLLRRLIVTKEAPVNAPYTFIFFDPHGNPVYVDVDDRVPCDDNREPKFAQSPYNLWYPLLLEKAYAKFVGGYDQLINCTSLETLRDLTGRPVTHTPFKRKLAEAGNLDNYMTVDFWLGVKEGMARGDVVVCSSNAEVPNGIHPCCSYALVDVVITLEGSVNPSDIVIKLENSYRNGEPVYTGPLCHTDVNWSLALQRVCQYDPERDDVLYLPLPTFLRNFSSMQTCHINCGDRLTVAGMWNDRTSGGNANFTTFRNNPIFILQNNSSRPATVLAELRHAAPQFVDPEGRSHYPQSGIALMEPTSSTAPLTPLITNSTARFLHKSIMLDSREVCSVMEVPAHSMCLFIPYTANPGQHGAFYVSVYPGSAKVALTPLHYCGLSREPKSAAVTLTPGAEGQRVDFTISSPCDVHVLLRQEKMTDRMAAIKGDAIAEDDVVMVAFSDQAMKLTSSGDPTNAREHSLVFRAEKPGYYSLLLTSPNEPFSGDNPCTVSIFTPKRVMVRFVAPPAGARQLQHTRFPKLPQKLASALGGNNPRQSRGASTACQSQQRQHDERLPPLRKNGASTLSSGSVSRGDRFTCSF
ncbi:Calpain cysteine protease family protein [Leishmania donovani]|uniref:Calpain cysteine protease family protein n=1 Tax=Leishmania donovani TaxID=5661 RepID=A0A504XFE1_LEIDO|nr:Calpain cysteine protease family protein [Leishmania donovani]